MKKTELVFNIFSIPIDAAMLLCAAVASFFLRQHQILISRPIRYELKLEEFLLVSAKLIPVLLVIFAVLGLYNLRGTRRFASEFGKIVVGISLGLLFVLLLFFFDQQIFPSRYIILVTWALGITFVFFGRAASRFIQRRLFSHRIGLHKLVVIDGFHDHAKVIEDVFKNPRYGYEVVAELPYDPAQTIARLEELFSRGAVDEILQANPAAPDEVNLKLVEFARGKGLAFSFVPNLFEAQRTSVELSNLKGIPVIALKNTPLDGWGQVAKRVFDIVASGICLVLTAPVFAAVAVAIKLDSSGRIIYSAPRGGCGKDFMFYKFRSMYSHLSVGKDYGGAQAEQVRQELWQKNDRGGATGPFLKIKDDPRVTRVGRFLRRSKLDEIPQFWNVLKGDMSMVGPRAHVLDEVDRYRNRYRRMFSIKPGIFGMSQIAQASWPDLPFEEEIRLNTYYIENWSLWLDIKILVKSFYLLFFAAKPKEDY